MKFKILIVDDEPDIRLTISQLLKARGFNVEEAENGDKALKAYSTALKSKDPFSVILLDVIMPSGIDGLEVLASIRRAEKEKGIKIEDCVSVIMVTAFEEPWMESFNKGCDDYILKPYSSEELLKKIEQKFKEKNYIRDLKNKTE